MSLYHKNICAHPGCNLCDRDFETSNHLFFGCRAVAPLWRKINNWIGFQPNTDYLTPTSLRNYCRFDGKIGVVEWQNIFPFILCSIWIGRNDLVFNKKVF